ncbi:acetyltransferase [Cytobacillus firmus]|nr:acetyltransferase [Cytobacillus firmus]
MKLAIIGQGGHSKVIEDLISLNHNHKIVAYLDDKYEELHMKQETFYGPILSANTLIDLLGELKFVIAIGNNKVRRLISESLHLSKEKYATLIHPAAIISQRAKIEHGTVIMAGSIINAGAHIGAHTIINTGAIVEHDNRLGDFVHISPNATLTGTVHIEDGVHVGAGATIIPGMAIGEWSVIGAGATVISNIPSHSTAVGVPATVKTKQVIEGV